MRNMGLRYPPGLLRLTLVLKTTDLTNITQRFMNASIKFRTPNNKLPIEKGRWRNIDSAHFVTKTVLEMSSTICIRLTYIDKLRKLHLHRTYFVTPNIIKFKDLFTSTNFETLNLLTIFIKETLNVCSSKLYIL